MAFDTWRDAGEFAVKATDVFKKLSRRWGTWSL